MERNNRKTISDSLQRYDIFAKENDFIEITEWTNGEGIDISLNEKDVISLTYGQLDAIYHLSKELGY